MTVSRSRGVGRRAKTKCFARVMCCSKRYAEHCACSAGSRPGSFRVFAPRVWMKSCHSCLHPGTCQLRKAGIAPVWSTRRLSTALGSGFENSKHLPCWGRSRCRDCRAARCGPPPRRTKPREPRTVCTHAGCAPDDHNARRLLRHAVLHIAALGFPLAQGVGTPPVQQMPHHRPHGFERESKCVIISSPISCKCCARVLQPTAARRAAALVATAGPAHRKKPVAPPRAVAQLYAAAASLPFVLSSGAIAATGAGLYSR